MFFIHIEMAITRRDPDARFPEHGVERRSGLSGEAVRGTDGRRPIVSVGDNLFNAAPKTLQKSSCLFITAITKPTAKTDNELVFIVLRIRVAPQDFQNYRLSL